jgi:hypothetical protein
VNRLTFWWRLIWHVFRPPPAPVLPPDIKPPNLTRRRNLHLTWLGLAAAAALLACGTSSVAPTASPTLSPTSIASYGPIGLPAIPNAIIVSYTITGSTTAGLRAQMDKLGPQHFDAFTRWDFSWTWPPAADGSCDLSKATVNYTIKVTGPIWTPPPGVDPSLVAAWRAYMTALATHEKGHIDFVVATAPQCSRLCTLRRAIRRTQTPTRSST